METTDRFYTLHEIEKRLGTYSMLLHHLIAEHRIPYRRIGYAYLFDEAGFTRLRDAYNAWKKRPRVRDRKRRRRPASLESSP